MKNVLVLIVGMTIAFMWGAVAWTLTQNPILVTAGAVAIGWIMNQPPKPPRRRKQRKLVLRPERSWT